MSLQYPFDCRAITANDTGHLCERGVCIGVGIVEPFQLLLGDFDGAGHDKPPLLIARISGTARPPPAKGAGSAAHNPSQLTGRKFRGLTGEICDLYNRLRRPLVTGTKRSLSSTGRRFGPWRASDLVLKLC